jgi:acyl carrier protein
LLKDFELKLKAMIIKYSKVKIKVEDISEATNLVDDLGYDSIDCINFVLELENGFNMQFDDEELTMDILGSYSRVREYVKMKLC